MQRQVIRCLAVTAVCFMVIGPATAVAMADTGAVAGITIGGSSQAVGDSDQPYLGPGFGGTTWSSVAFGEAVVRHHWSVGGEASLKLPDLSQVLFLGIDGHRLLMIGILFCIFGLGFGLVGGALGLVAMDLLRRAPRPTDVFLTERSMSPTEATTRAFEVMR